MENESIVPRLLVVAGLVVNGQRVLLTQRRADQSLALQWELPGGKVEPGESPVEALARELREEIGARVQVGVIWEVLYHRYPDFELVMLVYRCALEPGETARPIEVAELAWCLPPQLAQYDVLPADAPLIDRLVREGPPPMREKAPVV